MSKVVTPDALTDEDAGYKAAIEQMLAEMRRNREAMSRDQEEIEQLKIRTRARLVEVKKVLERL